MSNVTKSRWQAVIVKDGLEHGGIVSVERLAELLGFDSLQHTTNNVKIVLARLADNGLLYHEKALTRDKDIGVAFRYTVPGGSNRATEEDLTDMLVDMFNTSPATLLNDHADSLEDE